MANMARPIVDALKFKMPDGSLVKTPESRSWEDRIRFPEYYGTTPGNLPEQVGPGPPAFKNGGLVKFGSSTHVTCKTKG